jgi:hypothetical protein
VSNPHFTQVINALNILNETSHPSEAMALAAVQAQATLALAYEMRTANLIAMWSHPHSSLEGAHANHERGNIGWSIGENTLGSLLNAILTRLGTHDDGSVPE